MQQSVGSRKRQAPGTSPLAQQQSMTPQNSYYQQPVPENTADFNNANFDFSTSFADSSFAPPALDESNQFAATFDSAQPQTLTASAPSTDLVRRAKNQLATAGGGNQISGAHQEGWNGTGYNNMTGNGQEESETELEAKVALAKREASGKRKQIPPFVMKLSR